MYLTPTALAIDTYWGGPTLRSWCCKSLDCILHNVMDMFRMPTSGESSVSCRTAKQKVRQAKQKVRQAKRRQRYQARHTAISSQERQEAASRHQEHT